MKRRFLLVLSILLSFTLIAAACGDDDDTATDEAPADSGEGDGDGDGDTAEGETGDGETGADECERTGSVANPIKPDDTTSDVDASGVTAGFVYLTDAGDAGWTWAHDRGAEQAAAATGATLLKVNNIAEGSPEFEQAVRDFIADGANAIFATSFGYMDAMEALSAEFPDVDFFHATGFKSNDTNFGNYFGRIYQARYLTGLAAGEASESGNIGYVAAFPIPEVIRGINAFTLGVREANPDATVTVNWTSTWFDPAVEGDAAQALLDQGADVIAMHQDSTAAGERAEAACARWVSYNSDMSEFAPNAYLASAIWNWGQYYADAIESVADGSFAGGGIWPGMETGLVQIGSLADDVSGDTVSLIEQRSAEMIAGDFDPFTGPINDQDGNEIIAAGEIPPDFAPEGLSLLGMSVFVEGVIGTTTP
ncbi:MAG: BMP family ABC transporter substrate-binding protein [Actinomycetota bacterium]